MVYRGRVKPLKIPVFVLYSASSWSNQALLREATALPGKDRPSRKTMQDRLFRAVGLLRCEAE
jgi:hypothetical protein